MWIENFNSIFEPLSQSDTAISPDTLYTELLHEIASYHPSDDITMISKAYQIANTAHSGQFRKSGEPFIIHPLCVAIILSKLKMDKETIEAALLHDVVEDTNVSNEEIQNIFGNDVAHLVAGVTKLSQLPINLDIEEVQAANLRKMFLAMAKDIRVIIIKLADRLHNLRTLQFQPPNKQKKIAKETIEIYAPLALKLGISKIKVELDDLSLQYLHPNIYQKLTEELNQLNPIQSNLKKQVLQKIEAPLKDNNIEIRIYARTKHLFSIYKKMVNYSKNIDEIYDSFTICIIVSSVRDCYTVLGILHENFHPIYGRFKDYIAMPKQNMYQSLHTTLVSEDGRMLEVQIKTYQMLLVSEYGITVYWKYNKFENGQIVKSSSTEKMSWLQQILNWQNELTDNRDFLKTVKEDFDLLSERISCFTPKGDVKTLPKGATAIDFAYNIHTSIGNTMLAAKINNAIVPPITVLRNGDIVEVITSLNSEGPEINWLKYVKTPQAKNKINEWLKNHIKKENVDIGINIFRKWCIKNNIDYDSIINSPFFNSTINTLGYKNENIFWISLFANNISISQFIRRFEKISGIDLLNKEYISKSIIVKDKKIVTGNHLIRYAKCCNPMPEDKIVGILTKARGISVHRVGCPNLENTLISAPEQIVQIDWLYDTLDQCKFSVLLNIHVKNRIGLLGDITKIFANNNLEITSIDVKNENVVFATINITFYINNKQVLSNVIAELSNIPSVLEVRRH